MKLKYFHLGKINNGYGPEKGIVLEEKVFSISKQKGRFVFQEECDGYFSEIFTKDQAIELLQEAVKWIKEQ